MSTWNNDEIVKDDNGKVKVDVFTNAAKVELYLNGKKMGEDRATNAYYMLWDIIIKHSLMENFIQALM